MVTYFRSEVVEFIFGGRNSGQRRNEEGTNELPLSDANEWQQQPEAKAKFNLWTCDHGLPHLRRVPVCTFARRTRSGRRNRP